MIRYFKLWLIGLIVCIQWPLMAQVVTTNMISPDQYLMDSFHKIKYIVINTEGVTQTQQIQRQLTHIFDFKLISKLVLGRKHWRALSSKDRIRFSTHFQRYLMETYLTKMSQYANTKVTFNAPKYIKRKAYVKGVVYLNDQELRLNFKLYQRKQKWIIYDIEISGVSLVYSFRTQFLSILEQHDFEFLINELQSRQQLKQS